MTGAVSGAVTARIPYALTVSLDVCDCAGPREVLGTARTAEKLVPWAVGYWSLYESFWGHLPRMITLSIVDTRDGAVMWRNGKQLLQEDDSGNKLAYQGDREHRDGGRDHGGPAAGRRTVRRQWAGA